MSLPDILQGLRDAEAAAGRSPGSVRLVAVTKGHSLPDIRENVLTHGSFPLAENRGQELRDKVQQAASEGLTGLEWHFIGPVQSNKVKYLKPVTLIHSLETLEQARLIAAAAEKWGHAPGVLIQMHNGEAQKHGVEPEQLPVFVKDVRATGLDVRGLMVMAPYDDPSGATHIFQETAARAHDLGLSELSMGMSDDYTQAVAAGSTLVRVGRKLFT